MKAVKALLSVAAGLVAGGLALAGPASAQLDAAQIDDPPEFATYSATGCEVSVAWQNDQDLAVWLVVDAGGEVDVTEVPASESATSTVVDMTEVDGLAWRIFGGPERDYDDPQWSIERADLIAYIEANGDDWVMSGVDGTEEWVTWHTVETPEECQPSPEPTPSASATATPTEPPADEDGAGGELPETSGLTGPVTLTGAAALLLAGGGVMLWLGRRRRA